MWYNRESTGIVTWGVFYDLNKHDFIMVKQLSESSRWLEHSAYTLKYAEVLKLWST